MMIFLHVSEFGWEGSIWSEDSLATKRMFPGYLFPTKVKSWNNRLRTSEASMRLAVRRLQNNHSKLPAYMRKKADTAKAEQIAERAAVVENLARELLARIPINEAILNVEWRDAWADGSDVIDVEVQALLMDKRDDLDITVHVPLFKKLIDQHYQKAPVSCGPPNETQQEKIDIDAYTLFVEQSEYDTKAFWNWHRKCSNVFVGRHHAIQEWALMRRKKCEDVAAAYMDSCIKTSTWQDGNIEQLTASVMDFKRYSIRFAIPHQPIRGKLPV